MLLLVIYACQGYLFFLDILCILFQVATQPEFPFSVKLPLTIALIHFNNTYIMKFKWS